MVKLFYIPENKREIMMKFVELAEKNKTSYSKLLVKFMNDYVEENTKKNK